MDPRREVEFFDRFAEEHGEYDVLGEGADRIQVIKEGFRILSPGGRLFSYDPSAHSPSMWLYRDPRSPFFSDEGKTQNEVLLRRDELAAELRAAGFDPVLIRGIAGITF